MMKKYYAEEIVKDTQYRQEYLDGLNAFLNREKENADNRRSGYIDPKKFRENPEFYREELKKQLGFPLTRPVETPVLAEKIFVTQDGNVNIYRMQLIFFGSMKFYGLYFEQTEQKKGSPFILSLHGGGGTPELCSSIHMDSANYNHQTRRLTDRGANVFAPQLLLWSEDNYGNPHIRTEIDGKLRQLGGSITAFEVWCMQGCINWFIENEKINAEKIGVAGLSYGGMYSLFLTAVETRIKACFSCSWFNDEFVMSWPDWSYRSSADTITSVEVAALVCPRALVLAMGNKDEIFDSSVSEENSCRAEAYYKEWHAEEKYKFYVFEGPHELDKGDAGIDFLFANL